MPPRAHIGPDPGGMPFRRIADIAGRTDDIAYLPALAGGTVAVLPQQLRTAVGTVPGLVQYQIVVGPDGLRIAVVLQPDAPADTPQRIQAALQCALLDANVAPPPIVVEPVGEIARNSGPSGKFTTVKVVSPADDSLPGGRRTTRVNPKPALLAKCS